MSLPPTFAINAAICGATGVIIAMIWVIQPFYGIAYSVRAFVIVTAAGLGNLPGVIVTALGLGTLEQYSGFEDMSTNGPAGCGAVARDRQWRLLLRLVCTAYALTKRPASSTTAGDHTPGLPFGGSLAAHDAGCGIASL